MADDHPGDIAGKPGFLPSKVSPSVSAEADPKPEDKNPAVRQPRLLIRRFLAGSLYRHRGYWHSRVRDLVTGAVFRMSSGERSKEKADGGLTLRLKIKGSAEKIAAVPYMQRLELMERARRAVLGEKASGKSVLGPPLECEFVEDETYQGVCEALKEVVRLADRGQVAVTPGDLERLVDSIVKKTDGSNGGQAKTGPIFSVAFDEFLKSKDVNAYTLADYKRTGKFLSKLVGAKHVHEIVGSDIQETLNRLRDGKVPDGKPRAQRTRQKQLVLLRDFFRWCRDVAKYVTEDPTVGLKVRVKRSQRKKIRKGLTLDAAKQLLQALRLKGRQKNKDVQHVWLSAFIALRTGLRLSNVLCLRWFQIDLKQGTLRIPAKEYKADRKDDLVLPLHVELWRVLRLWRLARNGSSLVKDENYLLGRQIDEIKTPFNAAAKRAGIETDFHNLRHAFETWLVDQDVPGAVQKALMGHSPGSVTEGYAHPSIEKMRECVNRLPRLLD